MKETTRDSVIEKIKASGLRLTQSRLKLIELLEGTHRALSPSEILTALQKKFKSEDFDRVTIYRILEKFEELEIVHPVGNGKYIYCSHQSCKHDKHFIAICENCGEVDDIGGTAKALQFLTQFLKDQAGFEMTTDAVVVRGRCKQCRSA